MGNLFNTVLDIIKGVVKREAARLIAYSSAAATTLAIGLAGRLGVELSAEFLLAVGAFAVAVTTEAIRAVVYSEASLEQMVNEAQDEPDSSLEEIKDVVSDEV